jgi:hypothetical protein
MNHQFNKKIKYWNCIMKKQFIEKKTGDIIESEVETSDLGITSLVLYIVIFSYAYINAFYKQGGTLGFSIVDQKKAFTVSHAMYNSEKIGVIISVILFLAVTILILVKQNFHKYLMGNIVLAITIGFGIILGGFMFIDSTKMVFLHSMMGAAMFIGGQTFSFLVMMLYDNAYPNEDISEITTVVYGLTVFFIILMILLALTAYITYNRRNKKSKKFPITLRFIWDLMGVTELIHLGLFGTLIYIISIYPPLPN